MSIDLLTNPYVIGYVIVLFLLFRAGSGLKRMTQQTAARRKKRLASQETLPPTNEAATAASMTHMKLHLIRANWDADAGIWIAVSDEVQSLVVRADTIEDLAAKLRIVVPEALAANGSILTEGDGVVAIELVARRLFVAPRRPLVSGAPA